MLIPKRIACLSKLCRNDEGRYALMGVQLSRGEDGVPRAVVTDGGCLLETHWDEPDHREYPGGELNLEPKLGFEAIIPKAQLVAASKLAPNRTPKPILRWIALDEQNANGTVPAAGTDMETTQRLDIRPLDGRFPRWQDVMPSYDQVKQWQVLQNNLGHKAVSICVNAKKMATLLLAALESGELEGDTEQCVELLVPLDREKPIVVKRGGSTGVIMPLKGGYNDEHAPEEEEATETA